MNAIQKLRLRFAGVVLLGLFSAVLAYPKMLSFSPPAERFFERFQMNYGLDLAGGVHLTYSADLTEIPEEKHTEALEAVVAVIERRVNAFGVGEPLVQLSTSGSDSRIIVDLPGVKDVEEAKQLIKDTPFLEFRELAGEGDEGLKQVDEANAKSKESADKILENVLSGVDFAETAKTWSQDPGSKESGGEYDFQKKGYYVEAFDAVAFDPNFQKGSVWPTLVESDFGWHIMKKIDERGEGDEREVKIAHILFSKYDISQFPMLQFKTTGLSGKNLADAFVDYQSQGLGAPQIGLRFDEEGTRLFAEITKRNIGKPVAIFLDQQIISQPTVQTEILNGEAVITGDFTLPGANDLVKRFNEGALPVPITLDQQYSIGAALAEEALHNSIRAGVIGLLAVAVFMVFFYRFLGLIAVVALLLYTAMLLALFKLSNLTPFPITMTLSGIAGFILSIGIAVDANVLIYERTREEFSFGKTMRTSLKEGFRRAWPSIRDGHLSTLITTIVLMGIGTGFVKGFAITLALGVLLSLFTAVVLVRIMTEFFFSDWMERHPWVLSTPKKPSTHLE